MPSFIGAAPYRRAKERAAPTSNGPCSPGRPLQCPEHPRGLSRAGFDVETRHTHALSTRHTGFREKTRRLEASRIISDARVRHRLHDRHHW